MILRTKLNKIRTKTEYHRNFAVVKTEHYITPTKRKLEKNRLHFQILFHYFAKIHTGRKILDPHYISNFKPPCLWKKTSNFLNAGVISGRCVFDPDVEAIQTYEIYKGTARVGIYYDQFSFVQDAFNLRGTLILTLTTRNSQLSGKILNY